MRPERRVDIPFAVVVLFVGALLQATLAPSLFGGRIQLVLLAVVVWAVWRELDEAVLWGLLGGAFLDLFTAGPFGASILALGVVAVFASWLGELLRQHRLIALQVLAPTSTVVFTLILAVVLDRLGWAIDYPSTVALVVVPSSLASVIAAPIVYLTLRAASSRLPRAARLA